MRLSRLRIQACYCSGSCSVSSLVNSACCRCSQKRKRKEKKKKRQERGITFRWPNSYIFCLLKLIRKEETLIQAKEFSVTLFLSSQTICTCFRKFLKCR